MIGDINGDGIDDFALAAPGRPNMSARQWVPKAGEVCVVFGKATDQPGLTSIRFDIITHPAGFTIGGCGIDDGLGQIAAAGDVNGDGIDDLMISAWNADPDGRIDAGRIYLIFGNKQIGNQGRFDLRLLDGRNGLMIDGTSAGDHLGRSMSGIGDVDGDGIADFAVSAVRANPNGNDSGIVYLVFGRSDLGAQGTLEVTTLQWPQGMILRGGAKNDYAGYSIAGGGDVNQDGLDDLLIGATHAAPGGITETGQACLIFGRR